MFYMDFFKMPVAGAALAHVFDHLMKHVMPSSTLVGVCRVTG